MEESKDAMGEDLFDIYQRSEQRHEAYPQSLKMRKSRLDCVCTSL